MADAVSARQRWFMHSPEFKKLRSPDADDVTVMEVVPAMCAVDPGTDMRVIVGEFDALYNGLCLSKDRDWASLTGTPRDALVCRAICLGFHCIAVDPNPAPIRRKTDLLKNHARTDQRISKHVRMGHGTIAAIVFLDIDRALGLVA